MFRITLWSTFNSKCFKSTLVDRVPLILDLEIYILKSISLWTKEGRYPQLKQHSPFCDNWENTTEHWNKKWLGKPSDLMTNGVLTFFFHGGCKAVDRKSIINKVPSVSAVVWDDQVGRDHSSVLPWFLWSQDTQSCEGISAAEDLIFLL